MSPTSSRVSLSGANVRVPATWMERITWSDLRSYVTVRPARTSTRAPEVGTLLPSQVARTDQGPLRALRTRAGPASLTGRSPADTGTVNPSINARAGALFH